MEILQNIAYVWLIAGGVMLILEFLLLPGVGFFFAGLGALITGLLLELGIISGPVMPWIIFLAATIIWALALWKPLSRFHTKNGAPGNFSDMVGHKAKLLDALTQGQTGRARWSGTTMNAKLDTGAEALDSGADAVIVRVEGNVLVVK